jgi:hypothetical protein
VELSEGFEAPMPPATTPEVFKGWEEQLSMAPAPTHWEAPHPSGAELLDHVFLSIPCPHCGERYEVPLENIYLSHQAVHQACPASMPEECPEESWAGLLDEQLLQSLVQIWMGLKANALEDNGDLVIRGSPEHHQGS